MRSLQRGSIFRSLHSKGGPALFHAEAPDVASGTVAVNATVPGFAAAAERVATCRTHLQSPAAAGGWRPGLAFDSGGNLWVATLLPRCSRLLEPGVKPLGD